MINTFVYIGNILSDIEENIEKQKNNFKSKYDKSNIISFDFSEESDEYSLIKNLKNTYENLSLFATKKLIILKNISKLSKSDTDDDKKIDDKDILGSILKYLKNSNDNFITIIQDEKIDKRSKFFKGLQELEKEEKLKINEISFTEKNNIENWILKIIKENNFTITKSALDKILDIFNIRKNYKGEYSGFFDTVKIKNQLIKIFDYKKDDKLIKEEDINSLDLNYENPNDDDIFELVNLIFQKDKKALKLFEKNFYNNTNEKLKLDELVFFNTIMINQLEDLIVVSDLINNRMSDADIANKLEWKNPKRIYPIKIKLRNFNKNELLKFYKEFEKIDVLSKTDQDISLYQLNLLIMDMISK